MTLKARSIIVLGGVRSGKSRRAQALAEQCDGKRIFIATAQAFDEEMRQRIAQHQADRDESWSTVEAPIELVATIGEMDATDSIILVDCLTLWLSNLLLAEHDLEKECAALTSLVKELSGRIIFVSNEVGLSVVPDNALARQFRDAAGLLNQQLAQTCEQAEFMVAGFPIRLGPDPK